MVRWIPITELMKSACLVFDRFQKYNNILVLVFRLSVFPMRTPIEFYKWNVRVSERLRAVGTITYGPHQFHVGCGRL